MNATQQLHDAGQSLWLDNITRGLLDSGTLRRYIDELAVTGLTSNPTIFDKAIAKSADYDADLRTLRQRGLTGEALFFAVAIADLRRAADLFRPVYDAHQRRRRLGLAGGLAPAGLRHVAHAGGRPGSARSRGAAQPLHQDPWHPRGPARHRGVDLRRHADQRDAALLARAVSRRRRGLHEGVERRIAAGLDPAVWIGGLDLRQPLG